MLDRIRDGLTDSIGEGVLCGTAAEIDHVDSHVHIMVLDVRLDPRPKCVAVPHKSAAIVSLTSPVAATATTSTVQDQVSHRATANARSTVRTLGNMQFGNVPTGSTLLGNQLPGGDRVWQ
jgi:hypothetical protein